MQAYNKTYADGRGPDGVREAGIPPSKYTGGYGIRYGVEQDGVEIGTDGFTTYTKKANEFAYVVDPSTGQQITVAQRRAKMAAAVKKQSSGYIHSQREYSIICPNGPEEGSNIPTRAEAPKGGIAGYSGHIHGKNETFAKPFDVAAREAGSSWAKEVEGKARVQTFGTRATVGQTTYVKPREDRDVSVYNQENDPAYHIPGYTGHIRGGSNLAGRTYAGLTREALTEDFDTLLKYGDVPCKPNTKGRRVSIGAASCFSVGSVGTPVGERK